MEADLEVETIRERLLNRAFLHDRPDCYTAGVRDALAEVMGHAVAQLRHDNPDTGRQMDASWAATAGA